MSNLAVDEPAGKAGPVGVRAAGPFAHVGDLMGAISEDPELTRSPLALRLMMRLASHAGSTGRCWRSSRKLAAQLLTDRKAVDRAAKALERLGWIRREAGRGRGVTVYHLPIERLDHQGRRSIETAENTPFRREHPPFSALPGGASSSGGARPPGEGAPGILGGGAGAPPVTSNEPVREPGHCYAGSLPTGEGDRILREAVVAAVAARDRQSITAAGLAIADALEGHTRFAPAYWRRLWAARKAGDPGPVLAGLDRAFAAGHGKAFFGEKKPPDPPPDPLGLAARLAARMRC